MKDEIVIKGAREHNLQNVDLTIPRNQMVVFTGVSGSGKSSLAFDTIYAEGQRRYVESPSSYARQFLKSRTLTSSRGFPLQFPLTRKQPAITRVPQSAR